MKRFLTLACILPILGCSPQQQNDAVMCGAGLMAANVQNAAELIQVAQAVPACRAMALDAMQRVVAEVMARRGIK